MDKIDTIFFVLLTAVIVFAISASFLNLPEISQTKEVAEVILRGIY